MPVQQKIKPRTRQTLYGNSTVGGCNSKQVKLSQQHQPQQAKKYQPPPAKPKQTKIVTVNKNVKEKDSSNHSSSVSNQQTTSASSEDGKVSELDPKIQKRFQIINRLGKGAYGIVWEAKDNYTGKVIALKKMFDAFRNNTDAQRTYREIFFLREFGSHPNIIKLISAHPAANNMDFYLTFPLMDTDLHKLIKNNPDALTMDKIREITYQILKAIKYIHSADVIHRDLKPANILADEFLNVKVADFGLARSMIKDEDLDDEGNLPAPMTDYVATRWYRPPEILLNCREQTKAVDIWGIGCILGEMIIKKPLFPGARTIEQIEIVLGSIEIPTTEEIQDLTKDSSLEDTVQKSIEKRRDSIAKRFQNFGRSVVNLIEDLLTFHPSNRLNVEQAISHSFFDSCRNPHEELTLYHSIRPDLSDNVQLTLDEYRTRICKLITEEIRPKVKQRPSTAASDIPLYKSTEYQSVKIMPSYILNPSKCSLEKIYEDANTQKGLLAIKKLKCFPTEVGECGPKVLTAKKSESYHALENRCCPQETGFLYDEGELKTHKVREIRKEIMLRPATSIPQIGMGFGDPGIPFSNIKESSIEILPPIHQSRRLKPVHIKDAPTARIKELEKKLGIGEPFVKYTRIQGPPPPREMQESPRYVPAPARLHTATSGFTNKFREMKLDESNYPEEIAAPKSRYQNEHDWNRPSTQSRQNAFRNPVPQPEASRQSYWDQPGANRETVASRQRQTDKFQQPRRKNQYRNRYPPQPKPQSSYFAPQQQSTHYNCNQRRSGVGMLGNELPSNDHSQKHTYNLRTHQTQDHRSTQQNRRPFDNYTKDTGTISTKELNELKHLNNNNSNYKPQIRKWNN